MNTDPAAPAPRPSPRASPAPPPARRALLRSVWWVVLAALIGLPLMSFFIARSVLQNEARSAWLLSHLPGLTVTNPQGALLGNDFSADRVDWVGAGGLRVEIHALVLRGLRWRWWLRQGVWAGLQADSATAQRIVVHSGAQSNDPLKLPSTLRLPVEAKIARVSVETLQVDALAPVQQLRAAVQLGAAAGGRHLVEDLSFGWDRLRANGHLRIEADAPYTLDAALQVTGADLAQGHPGWAGQAAAVGPLASFDLHATLRGAPRAPAAAGSKTAPAGAAAAPPAFDAQAQVRPFEAWPLGRLVATTQALDLAALASGAPQTQLSGRATVNTSGTQTTAAADIELDNSLPGRWNEGRLPLRRARLEIQAVPAQADRVELRSFELHFGDAAAAAGRVRGSGVWQGSEFKLKTDVDGLRPQSLDGRAAAMALAGPIEVVLRGLPAPNALAAGAPTPPASTPSASNAQRPASIEMQLRGKLEGTIDGAPLPVALDFDTNFSVQRLHIEKLRATSGAATAEFGATLQRAGGQRWQASSHGQLTDFDPLPWWPGTAGSAWRRGPHRLNALWKLDLALPQNAPRLPLLQLLQTVHGNGSVDIRDSALAGVPLQAHLTLDHDGRLPAAQRSRLRADLSFRNNRFTLEGQGDPVGSGDNDRWRAALDAGTLADLGGLLPLWAELAPASAAATTAEPGSAPPSERLAALQRWLPLAGKASGAISAEGRWPLLHTEGKLSLTALRAGALQVDQGSAEWRLDTGRDQPISLQTDLAGLAYAGQRLALLRGGVQGTLGAHRVQLDLAAAARPPLAIERALGLAAGAGTQARLSAEGGWFAAAGGGGSWRGALTRLSAGVWSGNTSASIAATASATASASSSTPALLASAAAPASVPTPAMAINNPGPADTSWIDMRDVQGEVRIDAQGRVVGLHASPGRAMLAGGLPLVWNAIRYRADGGRPDLQLQAEVGSVLVAPYLQRAQPGVVWGGDLRMSAQLDIRAGDRFDAEVVFKRESGDLHVTELGAMQLLGLTDASLTLSAHDGQWRFMPLLAGRYLGTLSGAVNVRTGTDRRWPAADAAIDGAMHIAVPQLAIWGGWVPPGWRVDGELSATARLSGRFGAPEYTGELRAAGVSVRNLLQGVAFSEGELLLALDGATARIERASLRGGDGSLSASGGASFGDKPQAQINVLAQKFRLIGRVDRQLVASGNAALSLQPDALRLTGKVAVDSGFFDLSRRDAPSLDDDVTVRRAAAVPGLAPSEPATAPRLLRTAQVGIDLDLGEKLRLRGRGLDTALKGQLRLTTPGGRLAVTGTVRAENGTYAAYGQKLEIDRGLVAFSGNADNPRLDILALRPNMDVRVGVAITGNALTPRVRLVSEPEMSETEKLSWLVLGRGADGLGRTDTAVLQRAAVALLAGEGEAPTDELLRAIGIDDLSVRQTDGEVRETVISLGKQLGRRWYVGYERGVNATAGTWQLIYRIAQRFTLRAQSGMENSLDLIWTWRFGGG